MLNVETQFWGIYNTHQIYDLSCYLFACTLPVNKRRMKEYAYMYIRLGGKAQL